MAKTVSAVGQAVVEAVLPRFLSKGASAAIGASIDSTSRPPRGVRIEWSDGKQPSLLRLPEDLFRHFELLLGELRVTPSPDALPKEATVAVSAKEYEDAPPASARTVTEQAFSLVSGLIKERTRPAADASPSVASPEIAEQLLQLASLRDAGVLTEAEFATKKAELLARM